jgi:hypothetical protein
MGNMERADFLGAFKDLGRLVKIGRMVRVVLPYPCDMSSVLSVVGVNTKKPAGFPLVYSRVLSCPVLSCLANVLTR